MTVQGTGNIEEERIDSLLLAGGYTTDEICMSGSSVFLFEDRVLKIQDCSKESENEYLMTRYLQGMLPVPAVYAYKKSDGKSYLLMGKCVGEMACGDGYMENPAMQCQLLAGGLKRLWAVDISDCPSDQRLKYKLKQAAYNVENGLVDLENVEPDTFGENGFGSPAQLLDWLYANMPEEEPVLSHGDYCLPNVFGMGTQVSGYIDLGRSGIADKWCDIAICYRSISQNYSGKYKRQAYFHYDDLLLFRELGIEPDWDKIRYYILLDELF